MRDVAWMTRRTVDAWPVSAGCLVGAGVSGVRRTSISSTADGKCDAGHVLTVHCNPQPAQSAAIWPMCCASSWDGWVTYTSGMPSFSQSVVWSAPGSPHGTAWRVRFVRYCAHWRPIRRPRQACPMLRVSPSRRCHASRAFRCAASAEAGSASGRALSARTTARHARRRSVHNSPVLLVSPQVMVSRHQASSPLPRAGGV